MAMFERERDMEVKRSIEKFEFNDKEKQSI